MRKKQRDTRLERPGHFIGLKFKEGWWFIQVLGTSIQELKPWVLLNENGNRADIAAQTAGDKDEIQDEQSNLLLEPNDEERSLVFQILIGVEPSRMNVLPHFGREMNLGLENIIEAGDDEVWITGLDSPYNNPSGEAEVFYINDMTRLKLQAYNPMDTADEARLSFLINKIHYATVTDVNMMKAMLQNQIPSYKHMMGLGATEPDQLRTPEWLSSAFGEHIKSTQNILRDGDATKAQQQAGNLTAISDTALQGIERGGGG